MDPVSIAAYASVCKISGELTGANDSLVDEAFSRFVDAARADDPDARAEFLAAGGRSYEQLSGLYARAAEEAGSVEFPEPSAAKVEAVVSALLAASTRAKDVSDAAAAEPVDLLARLETVTGLIHRYAEAVTVAGSTLGVLCSELVGVRPSLN